MSVATGAILLFAALFLFSEAGPFHWPSALGHRVLPKCRYAGQSVAMAFVNEAQALTSPIIATYGDPRIRNVVFCSETLRQQTETQKK